MERLLAAVASALEQVPVRYAVGGSIASTRHGEPRMTNDMDVLVDLGPEQVAGFRAAFGDDWYLPQAGLDEAVRRADSFNLIHLQWMDKVDVFVAGVGALQQNALDRAVPIDVQGTPVSFYTAEDIALQKLDWLRRSGGVLAAQRRDVVGVLKTSRADLDLPYLRRVATETGLRDLLEPCLRDAGLQA